MGMKINYAKTVPVVGEFDVIVCGGGPAGIGAAIAAAEAGAKCALVERFGFLGGMATAGFVDPMSEFSYNGHRVIGGIPWRFVQELLACKGAIVEEPRCNVSFDPEIYKIVAHRMVSQAGVTLFMNSFMADAITENNRVEAVVITGKQGLRALKGRYFIDATGDGDLAAYAGVEMLPQIRDRQPGTLCFELSGVDTSTERMHIIHQRNHRFNHQAVFVREKFLELRKQGVHVPKFGGPWLCTTVNPGTITVNMSRAAMDATDDLDYQQAEASMREDVMTLVALLKEHIEEFKNCQLAATATVAGIRESRRIKGMHVMTGLEYVSAHKFEDAIARACHPVDIHLPGDEGQELSFPADAGYIPFSSLVPEKVTNLLAAGRMISADADAFAAIRVQAPCMETGQAAGLAAALCCQRGGIAVQELPAEAVVAAVKAAGSLDIEP